MPPMDAWLAKMKVYSWQLELFKAAAETAGLPVAQWARNELVRAARRSQKG